MTELDTNDTDVKEELPENADYLTQLLDKLETASATERDKGTRFETLIRAWLRKEPTYADLFTDVQTWKEWASSHPDLAVNARDIGIDLVGTNADGTGYTAIQCKLYARNASVPKAGIDSFLAASAKPFFTPPKSGGGVRGGPRGRTPGETPPGWGGLNRSPANATPPPTTPTSRGC